MNPRYPRPVVGNEDSGNEIKAGRRNGCLGGDFISPSRPFPAKAPNAESDKRKTDTCLDARNLSPKTTSGRLS